MRKSRKSGADPSAQKRGHPLKGSRQLSPEDRDRCIMTEDIIVRFKTHVIFSKKYPNYEEHMTRFREGLDIIRKSEKYYGEGNVPADMLDICRDEYVIPKE